MICRGKIDYIKRGETLFFYDEYIFNWWKHCLFLIVYGKIVECCIYARIKAIFLLTEGE